MIRFSPANWVKSIREKALDGNLNARRKKAWRKDVQRERIDDIVKLVRVVKVSGESGKRAAD